jgi:phosphate transport system permease protein
MSDAPSRNQQRRVNAMSVLSSSIPRSRSSEESGVPELDRKARPGETLIQGALFLCGAVSIVTTVAIVVILLRESAAFFSSPKVSIWRFLTGTRWQPTLGEFGIWPLLNATLMVTAIGMLVAVPLGLCAAIYLSEYASPRVRSVVKPTLEILAGVPTIVYGYFALTFVTPILRSIFGPNVVQIYNVASAGIVVGIVIVPLVASLSEDALHAVPLGLREAAFGVGATRLETSIHVVVPAALSGISAAIILAASRAIGETMIVAVAAGAGPNLTLNPFRAAETITGHIVRISGGDLSYGSIDYQSLFGLALVLFLLTLALNFASHRIVARFREVYE